VWAFLLLLAIPLIILTGAIIGLGVLSELVLPVFLGAVVPVLTFTVLVLVPFAFISTTRPRALFWMYIGSFVYGVAAWMLGLVITLEYWGVFAVLLGLVLLGVGVVPLGFLAALFHTDWTAVLGMLVLLILTFGTRRLVQQMARR
jgi:hypothetical protein